jgi:hypothetical protein
MMTLTMMKMTTKLVLFAVLVPKTRTYDNNLNLDLNSFGATSILVVHSVVCYPIDKLKVAIFVDGVVMVFVEAIQF